MRIPLFDRLFRKPELTESVVQKKEANPEPVKMGIARARDSFESGPQESRLPNNLVSASESKAEQDSTGDQNSDDVFIGFQAGDVRTPYIVGGLWNSQDKPPEAAESSTDSNTEKNRIKKHPRD